MINLSFNDHLLAASEVFGRHIFEKSHKLRHWVSRKVRQTPFNREEVSLSQFELFLLSLGIKQGDNLLVHSAWDGMNNLKAKPSEVIAILLKLIGPEGTLIMPTGPIPMMRDQIQIYDVNKSPSSMGILTESFRRMPGTKRGLVPYAPVSAIGPLANRLTGNYLNESDNTIFGHGSPFWELGKYNGRVIVLGVEFVHVLTMTHCAFDVLGKENPIADFFVEKPFIVINNGKEEKVVIRKPNPTLTKYLATKLFAKKILQSGLCEKTTLGGIKIAIIEAAPFLEWHLKIARQTGLPYWGFRKSK
jgi:aminoglycoside 3-N-acetyltransferase